LKNKTSLFPLSQELNNGLNYLKNKDFSKSDHFIGRNISCLIKLSWSEEETHQRAETMANCIKKVIG
jgi:8-amino-3,8-dideoxy-alpha-D-manno-octulosonate transaminase